MTRTSHAVGGVRISYAGGVLSFDSPYSQPAIASLKARIPETDRRWNKQRKVWEVLPQYGDVLLDISRLYFGVTPTLPAETAQGGVMPEQRILNVRYVGRTKQRADGSESAYGWCDGGWSVVLPRQVLQAWFGIRGRPEESATLYQTLGAGSSADSRELKTAYRRMARQWHPDVCREPDAAEQFQRIQHAYEVLGDPTLRAKYDAGLALEAIYRSQQQRETELTEAIAMVEAGYRSPLRCGYIMATGTQRLARFVVESIEAWMDITNDRGEILVTSWPAGADRFEERWVTA